MTLVRTTVGAITIVIGSLTAVSALALLIVFGSTGTLGTASIPFATPTSALVADAAHVNGTGAATPILGSASIHVTAAADGRPVFVGIGRSADVDRYLTGVATDQVSSFADRSRTIGLDRHPGGPATPPGEQRFWVTSATSPSVADLTWRVQDGDYRIVVMHIDGTPGLTTQVSAEIAVPNMFGLSLGVLAGALLVTAGGIWVVVAANRRRTSV